MNPFLDDGSGDLSALQDGTFSLNVASAVISNTTPSQPLRTDASRKVTTSRLATPRQALHKCIASGVYRIIIIAEGIFNSLPYARMATIDITCLPAVLSNIIAEFANPAGIAKCQCIRELQALHIAWEVNLEGEFHFCENVPSRRNIDSHFLKRCIEKGWHQRYLFTLVSSMNSTSQSVAEVPTSPLLSTSFFCALGIIAI